MYGPATIEGSWWAAVGLTLFCYVPDMFLLLPWEWVFVLPAISSYPTCVSRLLTHFLALPFLAFLSFVQIMLVLQAFVTIDDDSEGDATQDVTIGM